MWSVRQKNIVPANKVIERMPSKKTKKNMISKRLTIAGNELNSEVMASFSPRFLFKSLKGLSTLSTLKDLMAFRESSLAIIEMSADITIVKSRMFQVSRM